MFGDLIHRTFYYCKSYSSLTQLHNNRHINKDNNDQPDIQNTYVQYSHLSCFSKENSQNSGKFPHRVNSVRLRTEYRIGKT